MRQYSIDNVSASWLEIDVTEGLAAGTSIQEARAAQAWSIKMGAKGRGVRVYNPDRSGTLTITVDQESQLHQTLKSIHQADIISRDKVAPFVLKDNNSGEVIIFKNAFILAEPDESRGVESATFAWVFGYEDKESKVPGKLTNVVNS